MFVQLTNVAHNIYWLACRDLYTLGMIFWRAQESFDGAWSDQNHGKTPTLVEYMEWYAKRSESSAFSYPIEWAGYNVPGDMLTKVYSKEIPDENKYDKLLKGVVQTIEACVGGDDYCIVGSLCSDISTLKHELAHAFWEMDKDYKESQKCFINKLDEKTYKKLSVNLQNIGYSNGVIPDEIQAYCSVDGAEPIGEGLTKKTKRDICVPFETTFNNKLIMSGLDHLIRKEGK